MSEVIIRTEGLTKRYGTFAAVNGLSFDIRGGEIFGFLGPNGAGKTTTINMLTGMAKITEGRIYYGERNFTENMKKAKELIGVVPDESNLYDELSGFDNLCFCGALYGLPEKVRKERAAVLLETFRLSDTGKKPFKAYSKGMKRKLTLAAALIHDPEILFLDEPTTGIDVVNVLHIRNLIKELNGRGKTIFLTTHYIEEAERLCDRVAFIVKGSIVKLDTVEALVNQTRLTSIVEISFENDSRPGLDERLGEAFPGVECSFKSGNTLRLTASRRLDIAPLVNFLASEGLSVFEAKLIKPSLEDAFVKAAGLDLDTMKKEKEKK